MHTNINTPICEWWPLTWNMPGTRDGAAAQDAKTKYEQRIVRSRNEIAIQF